MPTAWIHHPWDAPPTVLKAAGVELGLNYPKPIIDADVAREQLTAAIFKMWELEAAAGVDSNGKNEEVIDNSDNIRSTIPKVVPKEKTPCHTNSLNDQRVPSFHQNAKTGPPPSKRAKHAEEQYEHDQFLKNEAGTSRADEDLHSTAESSAATKQSTSNCSFSVPQSCSSSEGKASDLKRSWQEQIDKEQSSNKDGE